MDKEGRMATLESIEGIGPIYAQKLKAVGVTTVEGLLNKGATPKGRQEVAENSGISEKLILEWVNHADLFRIKGVAEEYADLLEAAGVDTVVELAQRKPENLFQKLVATNAQKKLVRKLPTESQIAGWVEQAKTLPRMVSY
jgi:predicted flap endonuclease-1-like 5' DNA nuclease